MNNIPVLIFPISLTKPFRFLVPIARRFISKKLAYDVGAAGIDAEPEYYLIASAISSMLWGLLVFSIVYLLQTYSLTPVEDPLFMPLLVFAFMALLFFVLHIIYPSILSQKIAELTDKQLVHVLRDMWIQSTSGVALYNILQNISKADYGAVSDDFQIAVREISAGERDVTALERVATNTKSEAFKRVLWHIIASMRTGVGLTTALESAVNVLEADLRRAVREYGSSLNFYLLIYLLFAAVIPAILITFLSMLSIFGVFSLSIEVLSAAVVLFIFLQFVVIGMMRVGRPEIL